MTNAVRDILLPTIIIVVAGLALTAVSTALQPRIELQRQQHAKKMYFDVLTLKKDDIAELKTVATTHDKNFANDVPMPANIHVARRTDGTIAGIILSMVSEGYNGPIDLLVGLNPNGTITQVRAIAHHESNGIGDAIDVAKSRWIESFSGKSSADAEQMALKRDGGNIDQITGATVTSRAVTQSVQAALQYFSEHRTELVEEAARE